MVPDRQIVVNASNPSAVDLDIDPPYRLDVLLKRDRYKSPRSRCRQHARRILYTRVVVIQL
jgi:hypothetical protein